ncbi:MAG: lipopolysaccharide heptosyltransferase II [Phycisphaerae bacterium]
MPTAREPKSDPQRILIIKPSSLGDIVHALPVLAALRRAYPGAHIAWLAGTAFAPLLTGHPLLNEVIPFDRGRFGRMLRSPRIFSDFVRFVAGIRRRRFDLIIDLQGLVRSGFLALASGAPRRVGFADARECAWAFYTDPVRCPPAARHAVERNLVVGRALGLRVDTPEFPLAVTDDERAAAQRLLTDTAGAPLASFTAVLPGARWSTKLWKPERIAALLDRLHAAGRPRCVLLGASSDRDFAEQILPHANCPVLDLVGRTSLRTLVALLDLSAQVVCHDSGPMHIAAALNKPIVAVFGPTDPARCGPWPPDESARPMRVVRSAIACAPCYRRRCGHKLCMEWLAVDDVAAAADA